MDRGRTLQAKLELSVIAAAVADFLTAYVREGARQHTRQISIVDLVEPCAVECARKFHLMMITLESSKHGSSERTRELSAILPRMPLRLHSD